MCNGKQVSLQVTGLWFDSQKVNYFT